MYINRDGSSRKYNNNGRPVRRYSDELELLRSSAVAELRQRGYASVAVEKPVERGDGRLVYVKVHGEGGGDLPNVAVECFTEVSGSVSRRAGELREALPGHSIILVFPERLAPRAAKYASCSDEVWLVSSDGEVKCYAGDDVEGLKTHLRNKLLRRALQARAEIKELLREYEMVRENLKVFSRGVLYTQKPLRDLFVVAAKLVLGDKLYPELANIPFLGPYNDRVISEVQRLRELREKISEKIVEVADEILKIETEFRVKKCKDDEGKPVYRVEQARWDISPKRPLIPSLEYLAKTYLTGGLDDVKRCIQMQESRHPVEGIHSYIMDEVAEEIREKAEKRKYAKRGKRRTDETMTNIQDDCIAVPRKLLEKMLEEILEMERILGDYRRPSKCAVKKLVMRGSSSS